MRLSAGAQIRAARALLRLERAELAKLTGVSESTLKRLEGVDGRFDARLSTVEALERFFAERGVTLFDGNEPGARLRLGSPAGA
jgi:predicted transcriptional regulator